MSLISKVKSFIQSRKLFQPGDTVVIGISGGADSVALTLILNELKHELGIKLHLAHYDHNLRPDSAADAEFVTRLAARLNLFLTSETCSIDLTRASGSLENAAREYRKEFFIRTADAVGANVIALAHHRDDLAETVLMRILRGTGLQGLQAIRPKRKLDGKTFVRPLLCVDRQEIEDFLKAKTQDFRIDETNRRTDFFRNKIRRELLPLLKKDYNPGITGLLGNLADTVGDDYDLLEGLARLSLAALIVERTDNAFTLSLDQLGEEPRALQKLILRRAARDLKGDVNQIDLSHWIEVKDLIENRPDGSIVNWPGGVWIQKRASHLIVGRTKA